MKITIIQIWYIDISTITYQTHIIHDNVLYQARGAAVQARVGVPLDLRVAAARHGLSICISRYLYLSLSLYIYIHIEREIERDMYACIHIYIYIYIYMYAYMYIHINITIYIYILCVYTYIYIYAHVFGSMHSYSIHPYT